MAIFKKIFSALLRISISIILLIFLFRQVDKKNLFEIIQHADKALLFFSGLVFFFGYILCLWRWEMLLKAAKIKLSLKRIIISFSGGIFFSLFLPSTIGGDLVRSIDLAAHTNRPREVVATVLLDRLSGYVGLVILALLAVFLGGKFAQDKSIVFSIAVITTLLIVILLALFNKFLYSKINMLLNSPSAGRIREAIKNLHQEIYYFREHKRVMLRSLMLSLIIQSIQPITFYLTAVSLGIKINLIYFFIFIPIIGAITMLPISIGGLGLRDATTIFFFAKAGVNKDLAFAMSLLNFFFIVLYAAIGGIIYALTVHHRRLQHHKSPQLH